MWGAGTLGGGGAADQCAGPPCGCDGESRSRGTQAGHLSSAGSSELFVRECFWKNVKCSHELIFVCDYVQTLICLWTKAGGENENEVSLLRW